MAGTPRRRFDPKSASLYALMYAVVKVGGKQYRVETGDSLVVDRMREDEGAKVALQPLLLADGDDTVFEGEELGKVEVEATVTGHERGEKIRVLKFKPKGNYKRHQGHRSELTRLEIGEIKKLSRKPAKGSKDRPRTATSAGTTAEEDSDGS